MNALRVLLAVTLAVAVLGTAGAGVAVAENGAPDVDCSGLHDADVQTDNTPTEDLLGQFHHECHVGVVPK